MRHETVTIGKPHGLDWKGLGYLISIVSVVFLGAAAWPKEQPPVWYHPVLVMGMLSSIAGMGCRYMAHLRQKNELAETRKEARRSQ
jgi:hypothetical protein